jgi:hypothetical protein
MLSSSTIDHILPRLDSDGSSDSSGFHALDLHIYVGIMERLWNIISCDMTGIVCSLAIRYTRQDNRRSLIYHDRLLMVVNQRD